MENILKKLRHKPEYRGVVINAPENLAVAFARAGFSNAFAAGEKSDFTLVFAKNRNELERFGLPDL